MMYTVVIANFFNGTVLSTYSNDIMEVLSDEFEGTEEYYDNFTEIANSICETVDSIGEYNKKVVFHSRIKEEYSITMRIIINPIDLEDAVDTLLCLI